MKFSVLKKGFTKDKLDKLKIDTYLDLSKKSFILQGLENEKGMVENILKEENGGLWVIDRFIYEMQLTYIVCSWYSNLKIKEFTVSDYDFIISNGIFDYIVKQVYVDYIRFKTMLDNMLEDELQKRNSLEGIIVRSVDKLLVTLNDLTDDKKMEKMVEQFQKVVKDNPKLLEIVQSASKLGVAK